MVVLLGAGLGFARWYFSGRRLAVFLETILFRDIQGRVEIDSIDWPFASLMTRDLPVDVHGLRVYDPHGKLVMEVPHFTATVDWLSAALPGHHVVADNLKIEKAWVLVEAYESGDPERPEEVGFVAAFMPRDPARRRRHVPGAPLPPPGPLIEVRRLSLSGVHLELRFPKWTAVADDIAGDGMLRVDLRDPENRSPMTFALDPRAPKASLDLLQQHVDLVDFEAHRFGQFPIENDALAFDVRARTSDGADVHAAGKLAKLYDPPPRVGGVQVAIELRHAGAMLERISHGLIGGAAAARIDITGPMNGPKILVSARGAVTRGKVAANIDHLVASLDIATTRVDITELEVRAFGGRAEAKGYGSSLGRAVNDLSVVITSPMNLAAYLPPQLVREAGTARVTGHLHLRGVPGAFDADHVDADMGRIRLRGSARLLGDELRTSGLEVALPEARATLRGSYHLANGKLDVDFDADAPLLAALLQRLDLPALAVAAQARGRVSGTAAKPVVAGTATVIGAPMIPRADAAFTYRHAAGGGRLDVTSLTANPFGGSINAQGALLLGNPLFVLDLRLDGSDFDLARIPYTGGLLAGKAHLGLTGRGTLAKPHLTLLLGVDDLSYAQKALGGALARVEVSPKDGIQIKQLTVGGAEEGSLDVRGGIGLEPAHPLSLDVSLGKLPMALIPILAGVGRDLKLGGTGSIDAHLGGSLLHPTVAGHLAAVAVTLLGTTLGDAKLDFEPSDDGRVRFRGTLLNDKLTVDGALAFTAGRPPQVSLRAAFDQVNLEDFLPALAARVGAHCQISGYVDLAADPQLHAELHLSRVVFDLEGESDEGGPVPLSVENKGEIVIAVDASSKRATFLQPMRFVSPTGEFSVEGFAGAGGMALQIRGQVQLGLLEFYLRRYVDKARGTVIADVAVTGTPDHPVVNGQLALRDAALQRHAQETEVKLPAGTLILSNDRILAQKVAIEVDGHQLTFDGSLELRDFRPVRIDAHLDGRVAGKLIEIAAPSFVTGAGGSAQISLSLSGDAQSPAFRGSLSFDGGLSLVPRGLRKEITLSGGRLRFANQTLTVEDVTGDVDDGHLTLAGEVHLANYAPVSMDLSVGLDHYNHRVPEVLEIEVNSRLKLIMRSGQLYLGGDVDVLDGAFVQRLRFEKLIVPERTSERVEPFWKASPLLADMSLNIHLQTTGSFEVHNQIAKSLALSGEVYVTGTPQRPVLNGQVHVLEGGTVALPGTKIKEFTVRFGEVSFSPYRSFPDGTPYVSLKADAPFVDVDQTEHLVFLEVSGTLSGFQWHLSTNTGLNEAKTVALITTGRTTDALRARARGEGSGSSAGSDLTAGQAAPNAGSSVVAFSDQIVKEFTGEFISVLIEDPVKSLLSLDCFHLSVGASSITSSFCKNISANLVLNGELEQGFGWRRFIGSLNFKAVDDLFLVLQGSSIQSPQEAEGVQNAWRLQLKYRFLIP